MATIAGAMESFLLDCAARQLSAATQKRYRAEIGKFVTFTNDVSLEDVTAECLRRFMADLATRPSERETSLPEAERSRLSPFSIAGIYRSLKTFLNWCVAEGLLATSPTERVRAPKLPKHIVNRLDENQAEQLLRAVRLTQSPERNLALVLLMLDSGLRRGEVLSLDVEDVTRWQGFVFVRHAKGGKQRFVPVSAYTRSALDCYLIKRPGAGPLFLADTGRPLSANAVRQLFNRLKKRLGWERLYPHLLRHSFANLYLKNGGDLKSLSQEMGHSRESTTADIYTYFAPDDLAIIHQRASPFGRRV